MQSLATYALVHTASTEAEAKGVLSECAARIGRWLEGKGTLADGHLILRRGERTAGLTHSTSDSSLGVLKEWELTEPLAHNPDAEFRTTLQLAQKGSTVSLYLTQKAGYRSTIIAPELRIPVKPPRVLFDLARVPNTAWHFGSMPVGLKPLTLSATHADKVIDWLAHQDRPMPVVALSEYEGEVLHPQGVWHEKVTERLFGMALVIRFTAELSWALTERLGKQWSCYHGAVRIYWPGLDFDGDWRRHDLMTAEDIMDRFGTTDRVTAAGRLLDDLFERFRHISTFSVRCPAVFPELRRASSLERITSLRRQVASKRDATKVAQGFADQNKTLRAELTASRKLADSLTEEVDRLERELAERNDELARVQNELDNSRLLVGLADKDSRSPAVQQQVQVTTVSEAIARAREAFATDLVFGGDVDGRAVQLKEDAGPPSTVYSHLGKLAEASRELRKAVNETGTAKLGRPICDWLTERGATASGEKQKTMEGRGRRERTWDFGDGTTRVFENHTKPNDAKSPNQCVRIYFDWCPNRKMIVVGSVGMKPGL